ncbi:uncharacterized protein LOC126984983 [Eriocheir sinensis]|uniref:uncharacterized protein LOC126984983 n=1 Tax=Eriocheir sinensis TaxID=95602 RepID=UPI0021C8088C|nr:uncharacterized protein LOC126984983 [Eriocheir sinensis]
MTLVATKSHRRRKSMSPQCHQRLESLPLLHLVLVLVLAAPVSSLRGPEEADWLSTRGTFGKYSSNNNSNSILPRLLTTRGRQILPLNNISHPFPTTSRPLSPLQHSPHTPKHHHRAMPSTANLKDLHPPPRANPTAIPMKVKNLEEKENAGGVSAKRRPKTNSTQVTSPEDRHALAPLPGQESQGLRVGTRPQHTRREGAGVVRRRRRKGQPHKRVSRRKAAYPQVPLTDSHRRSLTPGPPYDHYRRMAHVSSGAPVTLSPSPPTRHILPMLPPIISPRSGLSRSKAFPTSSPAPVTFFREDVSHGPPLYFSPTPPPRPYQRPTPSPPPPPRPYQLPTPRPLRFPSPTPPPFAITSVPVSPSPRPSLPFPTLPPHDTSPPPKLSFFRLPARHRRPNLRPSNSPHRPGVSSLGRSSTPRPLVQSPPPPPPSTVPTAPPPPPPPPPTLAPSPPPPTRNPKSKEEKQKKQNYPTYASVPHTSFTCRATPRPGLYGDVEAGCQVWHVCEADGRQHSFLCPNGTVFSQRLLTCDWWYNVHCGHDGASHLTSIHDSGLQESYKRASNVYGKKMTYKPIKPYLPNYEAPVTPKRQSEASGSPSTDLGQNQRGHSPLPRIRVLNSGYGAFPRFQLEGKFKTLWLR